MNVIKVQDCGCIALPGDIVSVTGLHPGATLSIELLPDRSSVLIKPIESKKASPPVSGVQCKSSDRS